jgi:hypothetical protein
METLAVTHTGVNMIKILTIIRWMYYVELSE